MWVKLRDGFIVAVGRGLYEVGSVTISAIGHTHVLACHILNNFGSMPIMKDGI